MTVKQLRKKNRIFHFQEVKNVLQFHLHIVLYQFKEQKKLDKINKIVHPQVFENYNDFLKKNSNSNTVYESALLFDYDNFKKNDYNILITCPENIRIERIMSRDNLEFEEVKNIINSQIDYKKKIDLANYHIENIDKRETKRITIEIIENIILADEKK